jgi:hypothetical protein
MPPRTEPLQQLGRTPPNDRSNTRAREELALCTEEMKMDRIRTSGRRRVRWLGFLATAAVLLIAPLGSSTALAAGSTVGFGFDAPNVSGFPTGSVALTGGGAFNLNAAAGTVHAGGGFSCTHDVGQAFLSGCLQGEGVRWDTAGLLSNTTFKCTGAVGEALKPATTGQDTVVIQADFYRAGDANDESFSAQMIVSATDIANDIQGVQNVWVQGVGCGTATVHFGA